MEIIRYGIRRKSDQKLLGCERFSYDSEFGIDHEYHLDAYDNEVPWMVDSEEDAKEAIDSNNRWFQSGRYRNPEFNIDLEDLEVVKLTIEVNT